MSDVTVCPECDRWMRIDNFNGMALCTTSGCSRDGVYLTQEQVQLIRTNATHHTKGITDA